MKALLYVTFGTFLLSLAASPLSAADDRLGGMRLLPGFQHQPLQGFDSIVGEVKKQDGLRIMYEIGGIVKPGAPRFGGSFSDRPKLSKKEDLRWYREQMVAGQPMHVAYRKDNTLLVSFPKKGMNLTVTIQTADEMAEALLMIMTYPEPAAAKPAKKRR